MASDISLAEACARQFRRRQQAGQQSGQRWGGPIAGMDNDFNLIQALQDDWDALSDSPGYRAALGRWQQSEPALGGFDSPAGVVRWCRSHPDPKEANPPVGALLRVAADPVAARTLLQVILPGLNIRIGRAAGKEGRCRRSGGGLDELAQEVLAAAWERITLLAGTSPAWPACVLVEGAWRRVRHQRGRAVPARSTCGRWRRPRGHLRRRSGAGLPPRS